MRQIIEQNRGAGQVLGHIFDINGVECVQEYSDRLIGIGLDGLKKIPTVIGVAGLGYKTNSIYGALRGGYLKTLVTDEEAALGVIRAFADCGQDIS